MVCEARRLGGLGPTPADLVFHRRLVVQIKASLQEYRLTLEERLKALIELEHHQQHQDDITTAVYTGQPLPAEEPQAAVYGLPRMTYYGPLLPIYELPASGNVEGALLKCVRKLDAQRRRIR